MTGPSIILSLLGAAAAALALFLAWPWVDKAMTGGAASASTTELGRSLYARHCASCHGVKLEGQPDWQTFLPSGRLPAPPHDASGHTWHHPDGVLFRITKEGTAAVVGGGYESDMLGFGKVMSDDEIRAVLAFIKSTWPEREQRLPGRDEPRGTGCAMSAGRKKASLGRRQGNHGMKWAHSGLDLRLVAQNHVQQ